MRFNKQAKRLSDEDGLFCCVCVMKDYKIIHTEVSVKNQWLNCSAEKQKKTILRREIQNVSVCLTMGLVDAHKVKSKNQIAF